MIWKAIFIGIAVFVLITMIILAFFIGADDPYEDEL